MADGIAATLREHLATMEAVERACLPAIQRASDALVDALRAGRTVLFCGNGGSAADAQHLAAELVGRFEAERPAYPAIALTTDTSALTALGNDYGFERVFARQVEALARPGDVLVALSTSGSSPNVLAAVETARGRGCVTIGLTGGDGGALAARCDHAIVVPSARTSRIQEAHITIGHAWCAAIDAALGGGTAR